MRGSHLNVRGTPAERHAACVAPDRTQEQLETPSLPACWRCSPASHNLLLPRIRGLVAMATRGPPPLQEDGWDARLACPQRLASFVCDSGELVAPRAGLAERGYDVRKDAASL